MASGIIEKSGWKLLWTNQNPTSAFSPQTINIDLSSYSMIMVRTYSYAISAYYGITTIGFKGTHRNIITSFGNTTGPGYLNFFMREFICNDSGIQFSEGYSRQITSSSTPSVDNNFNVPIEIYGQ